MNNYKYFLLVLKFLLKNYNVDYITEICDNYEDCFVHWHFEKINGNIIRNIKFSSVFENYIKECLRINSKYIIFPVIVNNNTIDNINCCQMVVFMYNVHIGILEFFDPLNNDSKNSEESDENFKHSLQKKFLEYITSKFNINISHYINVNQSNIEKQNESLENQEKENELSLNYIYIIWFIEKRIIFQREDPNTMIQKELHGIKISQLLINYKRYLMDIYIFNINIIKNNKGYSEESYYDICMIRDLMNQCEITSEIF